MESKSYLLLPLFFGVRCTLHKRVRYPSIGGNLDRELNILGVHQYSLHFGDISQLCNVQAPVTQHNQLMNCLFLLQKTR